MTSSSMNLFCCADDINHYLFLLSDKYALDAILYRLGDHEGRESRFTPTISTQIPDNAFRIFLHPRQSLPEKLSISDVKCIEWGWIDIRPGRTFLMDGKAILTATQIYGSDAEGQPFQAAKAISWLKRNIKSEVKFGVTGFNPTNNGRSIYKNFGYTERARKIIQDGGAWKTGEKHIALFAPL